LIMVLWVITILSVIVLEFSFAMRTEVGIVKNFQEELKLYAMAEGGVERTIAELVYKHDPRIHQKRKNLTSEEIAPEIKEWVTDGRKYRLAFDRGFCEVRVMGEAGKVNINLVSETMLRKIISNLGLEGEARDTVVDSILDWRDADDFYRLNGAENEFYQSLKEPYDCKNGNLDSLEELLLIRGVTPELFFGKRSKPEKGEKNEIQGGGLKDVFSVYASGEQIDVNSAPLSVLRFFLGIPGEIGRQIIKAREEKEFANQQDLLQRVPALLPFWGELGRFLIFRSNNPYYSLEVQARAREGGPVRGIKVIVKIDSREKGKYKIIQWVDDWV